MCSNLALYDMGVGWSLSTTPQWVIGPDVVIQFPRWILGGYSGSDFIMAPVDLPSTGKRDKEASECREKRRRFFISLPR